MQISVKSNVKDVLREYRLLSKDIKSKAMVRAINHAAKKAYSRRGGGLVHRIHKESGLKKGYVRDKTALYKADKFTLTATLKPTTRLAINLIEWVTTSEANKWLKRKRIKRGKNKGKLTALPKGVTHNAWGNKRIYGGTFVIKGKFSGKPVVISSRRGKSHQEKNWSHTIYGPSVWTEFSRYSREEAELAVNKYFSKEFRRQVALLVARAQKK